VPADKIAAAVAALTGRVVADTTARMTAKASPRERLKLVHDALNAMATSIYAPKERRDGSR